MLNNDNPNQIIGKIIREKRVSMGYTQEQLGKKVGYTTSPATAKQAISLIERGMAPIPKNKVEKFIEVLGLTEEWLIDNIRSYSKHIEEPSDKLGGIFKAGVGLAAMLVGGGILAAILSEGKKRGGSKETEKGLKTDSPLLPDKETHKKNNYDEYEEQIKHLNSLKERGMIDEKTHKEHLDMILKKIYESGL